MAMEMLHGDGDVVKLHGDGDVAVADVKLHGDAPCQAPCCAS